MALLHRWASGGSGAHRAWAPGVWNQLQQWRQRAARWWSTPTS